MNFVVKNWRLLAFIVLVVIMIICAKLSQESQPATPVENTKVEVGVETSVTPSPIPEPTPEGEIIDEITIVAEKKTSGYNISYVDEEFDTHLLSVMEDFNINVDASYIYATIFCESTFRSSVKSSFGAIGYMQVVPSTRDYIVGMIKSEYPQYSDISYDLYDPKTNVIYGLYYLKYIANRFGESEVNIQNINKILTCYNRGITGGKEYYNHTGNWKSEYANKIAGVAKQIRANGGM